MAQRVFTKDTMLDLVVNMIPLGILAFFMGLFVLWGPYDWDPLYSTLMLGIIGGFFVLLAILTYVSAIAIEGDAIEREAAEAAADEQVDGDGEGAPEGKAGGDADDTEGGPGLDHELDTAPDESDDTDDESDGGTDESDSVY